MQVREGQAKSKEETEENEKIKENYCMAVIFSCITVYARHRKDILISLPFNFNHSRDDGEATRGA